VFFIAAAVAIGVLLKPMRQIAEHRFQTREERISQLDDQNGDRINLSAMHAEPQPPVPLPSTEDLQQLRALDEVLAAKNDNDPRLDHELRSFSPAARYLVRERYEATLAEKRNERGTLVYLLGRDLEAGEDVAFLDQVLSEPPCRSLSSCDKEEKGAVTPDQRHYESVNEVTLAYPQIVALKSVEGYLKSKGADAPLSPALHQVLEKARTSPVRKVASLAEEILRNVRDAKSP
jgi:hypothetical protein